MARAELRAETIPIFSSACCLVSVASRESSPSSRASIVFPTSASRERNARISSSLSLISSEARLLDFSKWSKRSSRIAISLFRTLAEDHAGSLSSELCAARADDALVPGGLLDPTKRPRPGDVDLCWSVVSAVPDVPPVVPDAKETLLPRSSICISFVATPLSSPATVKLAWNRRSKYSVLT